MNMIQQTIDPLNHFGSYEDSYIIEACGLLPYFVNNPTSDFNERIRDRMQNNYQFFAGWRSLSADKATLTSEGIYKYPKDPDLYPLMFIRQGTDIIFIYEYGIVISVEDMKFDEAVTTRMD